MDVIAGFFNTVAEHINDEAKIAEVGKEVLLLSSQFPVPDHFIIPTKKNTPFAVEQYGS